MDLYIVIWVTFTCTVLLKLKKKFLQQKLTKAYK